MAAVAAPENGKVAASERHCVLCFETIIRALRAKLPLPKASPAVEDFKWWGAHDRCLVLRRPPTRCACSPRVPNMRDSDATRRRAARSL
jgi:hypothetical protein